MVFFSDDRGYTWTGIYSVEELVLESAGPFPLLDIDGFLDYRAG